MSPLLMDPVGSALGGAVLGAVAGVGLLLVGSRVRVIRRPQLSVRVLPYLRDLSRWGATPSPWAAQARPAPGASTPSQVLAAALGWAAALLDRVLGGGGSVRRRLARADSGRTLHDFRVAQVVWGLVGLAAAAAYGAAQAVSDPGGTVVSLVLCVLGFVAGLVACDQHLTRRVRIREQRIMAELPAVAELLALAVAAGEGPVAALDRVVGRSGGELSADLGRVLAEVRTGEPVPAAFDRMAAASGLPLVSRFAQGIAVAAERGTPLAAVLHAQAADVRDAGRRELIEVAARREVLMMVPVVFLVLPVTVMFAFWPGVVGLSLSTP